MGTKVQSKTCLLPGYYSMRDLNEDSSNYGWQLFHCDKPLTNGNYYNGYSPRATTDTTTGCDKDVVKQTMLEHETIFKKQVYELHRLYQIQSDLMEETKRKELHRNQYIVGTSFCPRPSSTSQITIDGRQRWHVPGILADSFSTRALVPVVESIHSPAGAVKESISQDGTYTPQTGGGRKDFKVQESRPTKVRRKTFDLQLPADEYLDSDESDKFSDEKGYRNCAHIADRNCKIGSEISLKLLVHDGKEERSQEDTSRSEQSVMNNSLADLNQPVRMEETNVSSDRDPLGQSCHLVTNGFPILPVKNKTQFLSSRKENLLTADVENGYELQNNLSLSKSGNDREWIAHVSEAAHGKSGLQSTCHGYQPEGFSSLRQPMHKVHGEVSYSSSNVAGSRSHSDTWCDMPSSIYKNSMSTQMYSCLNSSEGLYMNRLLSGHSNGIIGELSPSNSYSKSNRGLGRNYPAQNGFDHGAPSGVKENEVLEQAINLDSGGYCKISNLNDLKPVKDLRRGFMMSNGLSNKLVTEQGPAFIETERKQETPLVALPWLQSRASTKNDEPIECSVSTGGVLSNVLASSISKKNDSRWGQNGTITQNMTSMSCSNHFEGRRRRGDSSCSEKILGVPIFEESYTTKNVSSSIACPMSAQKHSEDEILENRCKIRVIDINLPCDLAVADLGEQIQRENLDEGVNDTIDAKFRCQIDLNLSVSDEEASTEPTQSSKLKMRAVIDLEIPAVCEMEDDDIPAVDVETPLASPQRSQQDAKQPQDELMIKAAEAIVAISSAVCSNESDYVVDMASYQSKPSVKEPLAWFVDIVSSCFDNLDEMLDASDRCKHRQWIKDESSEFDAFESLTLAQAATEVEDYMPQPLVAENFKLEEPGPSLLPTRPRRGPARRGRQRRDFQRDILPGLATLSRHEVREDLQTFGGLMRATGHSWNLGLTGRSATRSRCGRGRRRMTATPSPSATANAPCTPSTQQTNNIESGLEDRNLTGWGMTPRRPRRQRCAAAVNPPIPLTQKQ